MRLPDIEQGTQEWHEARAGRITASLAAACLGLDPHKGPLAAFNEITGKSRQGDSRDMRYGREFEAEAGADYEASEGLIVSPGGFWVHDALPWLGASPDGLVNHDGLLEVKCPGSLPPSLPRHHEIQMRVQLACTGRAWCHYWAWVRPEHVLFTVTRRESEERILLDALERFYRAFVLTGAPPPRRRPKEAL